MCKAMRIQEAAAHKYVPSREIPEPHYPGVDTVLVSACDAWDKLLNLSVPLFSLRKVGL